jgi:hypothetical protein
MNFKEWLEEQEQDLQEAMPSWMKKAALAGALGASAIGAGMGGSGDAPTSQQSTTITQTADLLDEFKQLMNNYKPKSMHGSQAMNYAKRKAFKDMTQKYGPDWYKSTGIPKSSLGGW